MNRRKKLHSRIDVHRKVDLQDAEVTKEQQKAFKELCNEYRDIFL